ncbi:hypothetical protein CKO51_24925 [Rhodopirellula sp. SM50]|nr:TIGR03067 domain-containing protein [Rhodopirellula sp. SM50]PAY16788.1 hypothetical protein CKO51_24925 [Rhodopirellula sp. SM50]
MPKLTAHPSREELSAYSLGQLPEERAVAIDTHINECEPCCETIVELSSEDTFACLLQEAGRLPTDLTADSEASTAKSSSTSEGIPGPLAEHPRYEIVRLIGKGGMGDVYEARHRMMERTVALKVIKQELMRKPEAVNRFHREVKAAAQLAHPNVVTAYDAEQAGDMHYMVMEFVDGVDLSQMVKDRGALPVADACAYICQAAIGLQHAHERGMVHRDIKPHNLMVTSDGTVKILDFGLASLAPEAIGDADTIEARGDLTAAGAIMGTPDFISPEQAEDARSADIRSDIYSLGSTLYFLLSGRPPFHDGSVLTKLKSHATEEPVALESLRDDVPEELTSVVARMTAKNPDDRFQTPAEVAATLSQFVETGKATSAEEPQTAKSKGFGKFLIGASLLGIAALLIVLNWQESVASKLARMKAPVALTSEPPENKVHVLLYTVEAEALGGHPAAICDIGNCRIAVVNQDISRTRDFSEGMNLVVSGPERTRQRAIDSSKGEYFTSIYNDSEAKCRFHNFNFTLTKKMISFGTTGTFWDNPASPGMLIMVDADTGDVITQPMKPKSERVFLTNQHREYPPTRLRPETHTSAKHPTTATTSISKPELKITGKTVNKGTAGLPSLYDWDFKGRDVGDLKVRLLLAQNGKTEVMQEFDFEELPAEFAGKVRLQVNDAATGADRKRRVNAILYVESPVPSRSTTTNEDKALSIDVEAPFSNKLERADLAPITPGETESLLVLSYWKGDMTHDLSMESMTEATEGGNATFLFVTLDWSPASPELAELQGEWETESLTEGGKQQLATENGFGGLLLQIKGNRFVIKERTPTGGISDVDTGRIEIDSTTTPKTIDFVGRDKPNQRSLGIYEFEDGVLRICLVEQGGTDAPAGERIPDTKPLKRPTTFDSPAGINVMLMEFRRTSDNTRKVVTRRADVLGMGKVVSFVPQESDEFATIDLNKSELAVELWVSDDDATLVQEGDRVRLEFEGWPAAEPADFFGGKVISLDPTADGAGMFRVLIKGGDSESWPDKRYLRPGVRANGWIFIAAQNPAQQSEARSSKPTLEEEASAPAGDVPAKENDIPNIQGTWQVTYSEDGGRIAPQEMLKEIRFVIDEQNLTTEIGGRKSVSTYKLDPSTNPKSIDLTENGRTKQAIYDLVGDTLRICIAESGEQRPTAFDSQPNSANDIVLILKRVKPDNVSADGTDDQKHNGPLSEELARSLIPTASSISNEDFQKLQTNPAAQSIKNKSLSLVLMTLDIRDQSPEAANDFRFLVEGYPKPSEIAAAMSRSRSIGYFSIIQPGYITECKITNSTDEIAQGKVTFNAPKLYIGSVTFEARKHEGTWRIEKFHLPSHKISIELGEDGNWHPKGKRLLHAD